MVKGDEVAGEIGEKAHGRTRLAEPWEAQTGAWERVHRS